MKAGKIDNEMFSIKCANCEKEITFPYISETQVLKKLIKDGWKPGKENPICCDGNKQKQCAFKS